MSIIDRQAALDEFDGVKVNEENCTEYDIGWNDGIDFAISKLSVLPTAERKGHWVEEDDGIIHGRCSSCGWVAVWQSTDVFGMDYCPHCGARMERE